ncbi:MAG: alkaline phosphatase family protein [Clostridia bacterium]|nr:alkaline phosphatase family protein [Clostridia bacterium]
MVAILSRIIVAIVTLSYMISGSYYSDFTADYFKRLNNIAVYENSTITAVGARNVHDIIEDHFSSELSEGKKVKKAVFIGYDGVRADTFRDLDTHEKSAINAVLNDGGHAYLSYAGGINFPYYNIQATDSAPGWTSMLTGELYYKTGVLWNDYEKKDKYPTLLKSLIDDNLADKTSFYSAWGSYLETTLKSEAASTADAGYNANYIDAAKYVVTNEYEELGADIDVAVTKLAVSDIQSDDCSDFIFALYESTDEYGHATGYHPDNEQYMNAFAFEDGLAQQIVDSIKARPTYDEEDWLIIMSTDHGGFNHSHGYCMAMERYTYIVCNKKISRCIFK